MEVEFTARQLKITKALREAAQEGMERIGQLLGRTARGSIVISAQRHVQIVELTVQARHQKFAATGKGDTPEAALREAIEHAEHQVRRHRDRKLATKRLPKEDKEPAAPPVSRQKTRAAEPDDDEPVNGPNGSTKKLRTAIAVHSFPVRETVVEPHLVRSSEAIALRPMTIEEAVKSAEFEDKELLIFRTRKGLLYVLHRRKDGQMELVEIP